MGKAKIVQTLLVLKLLLQSTARPLEATSKWQGTPRLPLEMESRKPFFIAAVALILPDKKP